MTDQEYKDLLKWCRDKKNQGTEEFSRRHAIKCEAIAIQQKIRGVKSDISNTMFWQERMKDNNKIARSVEIINDLKDKKRALMAQLAQLKF